MKSKQTIETEKLFMRIFVFIILLLFFSVIVMIIKFHHTSKSIENLELSESVIQELNRRRTRRYIPFTLDFPGNIGMPVIKVRIRNMDFYFVVDTGGGGNLLVSNGIKKYTQLKRKNTYNKSVKLGSNSFSTADSNIYGNNIDGILGYSFLLMHKSIVFDYKNKYILLDKKINYSNLQPMIVKCRHLYTTINYDGNSYDALIDTGCNSFFVNRKFIEDNIREESVENYYYINISIGDVYYENLKSFSFRYEKWLGEESVQGAMENNCFLGYSVFKNHIVYIDLENHMFGIE